MRSPELLLPFGHPGAWVAVVATLHVVFSHAFALGGFAMALAWWRAAEGQGDEAWLALSRRFASTMLVAASTVGALSGVWTWFTAMVVQPLGTAMLLRQFFWVWLLEWGVFCAEVGLGFAFVHALQAAWPARRTRALGWALVATSWLTLLLISGILAAMLSPGPPGASHFAALWTASWAPQALVRTGLALVLGGALGGLAAWAWAPGLPQAARHSAGLAAWGLLPLALGLAGHAWTLPPHATQLGPWVLAQAGGTRALACLALLALGPLLWALGGRLAGAAWARRLLPWGASCALLFGLVGVASYERAREQLRKPFLLPGLAYGHGVPVAWEGLTQAGGSYLAMAALEEADLKGPAGRLGAGRALFARQCASCHVLGGRRDPLPTLGRLDAAGVEALLGALPKLHPAMPPFVGNAAERAALAAWLKAMADEAASPVAAR